jgi:hypothetical protein
MAIRGDGYVQASGGRPKHARGGGKPAVRSPALSIELLATLGLALSTLVAITVVSIGIARAQPGLTATVLFIN